MASHSQTIKNKPLTSLQGLLFITGLVVFLYFLGRILGACQTRFGLSYSNATIIIWGLGISMVIALMYDRVLSYTYTVNGSNLTFTRMYGSYQREGRTIMFRHIEDVGTPAEMEQKYPHSRHERYTRRQCDIEPLAIVHISGNRRYICLMQPDEEIRRALNERKR